MHQSMLSPRVGGLGIPKRIWHFAFEFWQIPHPRDNMFCQMGLHLLYFIVCGQPFCVKTPPKGKDILSNPLGMPGPPTPGINIDWCITAQQLHAYNTFI